MYAGTPVRAAWSGRVVAITPWYGPEYGVSVLDSQGYEATYGHISPTVSVGQEIAIGDILGYVVVDHVDVKMRDSAGRFVDFQFLSLPSGPVSMPQQGLVGSSPLEAKKESAKVEFEELLPKLEKKQRLFRLGLIPSKEVEEIKERLSVLAPLVGKELPKFEQVEMQDSSSRPRSDLLLESTQVRVLRAAP